MNTHDCQSKSQAAGIDELRWQEQEQARRGEAGADAGDLRIAHALREPPAVQLPFDFAAQLAARVRDEADSQLEQRLLRVLVFAFALSAAVVVAWLGRDWMTGLAALLPGGRDALGWAGLAALCMLVNWSFGLIRRQIEQGPHAAA